MNISTLVPVSPCVPMFCMRKTAFWRFWAFNICRVWFNTLSPVPVLVGEDTAVGAGVLSEVCRQWEAETQLALQAGIRVVNMRLGVVLSKHGGALAKMLPIFNLRLDMDLVRTR